MCIRKQEGQSILGQNLNPKKSRLFRDGGSSLLALLLHLQLFLLLHVIVAAAAPTQLNTPIILCLFTLSIQVSLDS